MAKVDIGFLRWWFSRADQLGNAGLIDTWSSGVWRNVKSQVGPSMVVNRV